MGVSKRPLIRRQFISVAVTVTDELSQNLDVAMMTDPDTGHDVELFDISTPLEDTPVDQEGENSVAGLREGGPSELEITSRFSSGYRRR